jgi:hypothetical protein
MEDTDFRGIKIMFTTKDDILFMGENIFGHDFIHDFNVVNMKDRLSKITSDIDKLKTSRGGMPRQRKSAAAAARKFADGDYEDVDEDEDEADEDYEYDEHDEDEDDEDDDDDEYEYEGDEDPTIDDEQLTNYTEMADGETVDNLTGIDMTGIPTIDEIDALYNDRMKTRGLVKIVQHIKDLIYYSKLYIIGYFNSVEAAGEIEDMFTSVHGGKHRDLHYKPTGILKMKNTQIPKKMVGIKVKQKTSPQSFHQSFYDCVRSGFDAAITESGRDAPEMKPYFECMKKLYLFFENKNTHPFVSFNNEIIEDAMFLYVHDKSLFDTDENIYKILNFFKRKYASPHRGGEKIIGGALITQEDLTAFRDDIQRDCQPLFNFITRSDPLSDAEVTAFFAIATRYNDMIKQFENVNPPVDKLHKLVKQLKGRQGSKYSVLDNNKRNYDRAKLRGRNVDQELVRFSHALVDFIITYIYETVNTYLVTTESVLNKRIADDGALSHEHETIVQKISSTVAFGATEYIGKGNGNSEMLNVQHSILSDVANNKNIGSADKNLLLSFKRFAIKTAPTKVISQEKVAAKIASQNKIIRIVDNAVSPQTFTSLGVAASKVFCPNSSMVDAMGSFGSCVGSSQIKREKFTTEFMLSGPGEKNAYIGRSIYNEASKQLKIMYYANFHNFTLPHVEMIVDMNTSKSITVLSANNTFKSVINKILTIWMGYTTPQGDIPGSDVFWGYLRQKAIFSQLVSVGSLKSVGDLYQEINATAKNGAYRDPTPTVSSSYRIGLMGDRPSGVRAGYILLMAKNEGKHDKSIAGYFDANGSNTCAIIYEKSSRGGRKTKKTTKTNKKQSRKLKA